MFFAPQPTPYDLQWRMLGVHIRVHPFFWLMSLIMGWNALRDGFAFLISWVACVFVCILVHEFGHVLMGKLFGADGHIVLYSFGGLAIGSNRLSNRWQRVAVSFAGPLAGFILLGIVWFGVKYFRSQPGAGELSPVSRDVIGNLIWINLAWGIMNLLPIWPLDGGQMSKEIFEWLIPRNGAKTAYGISMVVSSLVAVNGLSIRMTHHALGPLAYVPILNTMGDFWIIILFGSLAVGSYQALQAEDWRNRWDRNENDW